MADDLLVETHSERLILLYMRSLSLVRMVFIAVLCGAARYSRRLHAFAFTLKQQAG